jgi:hypothetical protein
MDAICAQSRLKITSTIAKVSQNLQQETSQAVLVASFRQLRWELRNRYFFPAIKQETHFSITEKPIGLPQTQATRK